MLDAERPTDRVTLLGWLTLLQIDPTAAIAPSADLVAWSRLGSTYQPEHLKRALEKERTLYEHNAMVRPMSYPALQRPQMAVWPEYERARRWLRVNNRFRRDVLDVLSDSGPNAVQRHSAYRHAMRRRPSTRDEGPEAPV